MSTVKGSRGKSLRKEVEANIVRFLDLYNAPNTLPNSSAVSGPFAVMMLPFEQFI